ncbi:glycine zipper domain-containing protein [Azorhizobium doebereinerae]|uniref:glycine zipper domain-containing protein n=1 Tax=Azorhizobium doebereinerae TaxID=281091 RepID=UPI000491DAB9|nr:glycine zipper domain-containing protein [Azorhizobium doebereinerae]
MKSAVIVLAAALALAGCSQYSESDRAVGGGLLGAGAGALIGGAATGNATGALVGGALGAATGAVVGAATTPNACWARDAYGNAYQVRCP